VKNLIKALVEAQSEMGNAVKDSKNPFFKSTYADLNSIREACIPILNKHKIVVLQPTTHIEGKNFIRTILMHESGETIEGLTEFVYSNQNDAQAQGSGITYARRYGLQSLINIGAEDDDGNKASVQPKTPATLDNIPAIKNAYATGKITKEKAIELQEALTPKK
jgi:hypothetical protein